MHSSTLSVPARHGCSSAGTFDSFAVRWRSPSSAWWRITSGRVVHGATCCLNICHLGACHRCLVHDTLSVAAQDPERVLLPSANVVATERAVATRLHALTRGRTVSGLWRVCSCRGACTEHPSLPLRSHLLTAYTCSLAMEWQGEPGCLIQPGGASGTIALLLVRSRRL